MRRRSVGNTVAQVNSLRAAAPIGCYPVTSRRSCVVFASRLLRSWRSHFITRVFARFCENISTKETLI